MNAGTPLNKKLLSLAPTTGLILNDHRKGPKTPFPFGTVYTVLEDLSRIEESEVVDNPRNDPKNAIPLYIEFSTCLNTEGIKRTRDSLNSKDMSTELTIASIFSPLTRKESPGIPRDFEDALRSFSKLTTKDTKLTVNARRFAKILEAISGLPPKLKQEATQLLLKLLIQSIEKIKNPRKSFITPEVLKFVFATTIAEALKLQSSVLDCVSVLDETADINEGVPIPLGEHELYWFSGLEEFFISSGSKGEVSRGFLVTTNPETMEMTCKDIVTKRVRFESFADGGRKTMFDDVGREIQLGRHLGDDPRVVAAYRLVKLTFKQEQTFHLREIKTKKSLSTTKSKEAFYVIMDWFESRELLEARRVFCNPDACDYVIYQVLESLKYCHDRGVVHRDLKFANILFNGPTIRLIDFDLAKVKGVPSNELLGTAEFVAPEMIKGEDYDDKVDSWSLGILIFALLTGRVPFYQEPKDTLDDVCKKILNDKIDFDLLKPKEDWEVNEATIKLCKDLLEKDPKDRPSISKLYEGKRHPFLNYMEGKNKNRQSIFELKQQAFLKAIKELG